MIQTCLGVMVQRESGSDLSGVMVQVESDSGFFGCDGSEGK